MFVLDEGAGSVVVRLPLSITWEVSPIATVATVPPPMLSSRVTVPPTFPAAA